LLLLFLAFTYLTFFAGNALSARSLALRIVFHLLPLLTLGVWLVSLIRRRRGLPRSKLDLPLLVWLAAALAASLSGLCPPYSLERTWLLFTYALGFYLFLELQSGGRQSTVFQALFLTASVVCLAGLFEWFSWYFGLSFLPGTDQGWPGIGGWANPIPPVFHRLNATLGGSTPLAAYLAVLIPPALGWTLTTKRPQTRWALSAWLAVALLVEILTFSRGGVLALSVSLPLTGLGWIVAHRRWRTRLREWICGQRAWMYGALLLILLLTTVAAGFWLRHSFEGRHGSTGHRLTLWQVALEIIREHPWLGVGPANFGRALLRQNDPSLPRRQIQTAHNAYLNVTTEVGLLALPVGLWLLVTLVRVWLIRWENATGARRIRLMSCGAALVGLSAQLLVDTFTAPANWLPILVLAVFVLTPQRARRLTSTPRSRPWTSALALGILVISTAWLGWRDLAQHHFERSVRLVRQGDYQRAAQSAATARAMDPGLSLYAFQSGYIHGLQTSVLSIPSSAARGIEDYQAGLSLDPIRGKQTANMASLFWTLDQRSAAIEAMNQTVDADPRPLYLLNLGIYYEATGGKEKAWASYGRVLAKSPSWAESGFWDADSDRAAAWYEIVGWAERAVLAANGEDALADFRLRLAWAEGHYDRVEEYAKRRIESEPQSVDGYVWLARSLLEQHRTSDAMAVAEQAVSLAPDEGRALAMHGCARWHAKGDLGAIEELHRALFVSSNAGDAYACLGQIHEELGNVDAAIDAYGRALSGRVVSQDVEMTLYGRLVTFEPLPELIQIGLGEHTAAPWLKAARLLEQTGRCEDARFVYETLLAQDRYLHVAQNRLEALNCSADTET
jgi:putative inorganic carbon (HCO3(-)) transporter